MLINCSRADKLDYQFVISCSIPHNISLLYEIIEGGDSKVYSHVRW